MRVFLTAAILAQKVPELALKEQRLCGTQPLQLKLGITIPPLPMMMLM